VALTAKRHIQPVTATVTTGGISSTASEEPVPGLLLVFKSGKSAAVSLPVGQAALLIGRDDEALGPVRDPRISRRHAEVAYHEQRFWVTDLGSRNGTAVDGRPAPGNTSHEAQLVIRIGESLFLPVHDLRPFQQYQIDVTQERVLGPSSLMTLQAVARIARSTSVLHITGESGVGKESAARAYHSAGPNPASPFIAVNCATIPEGIAERLLFGVKRGAYSGADADTVGYVQAADGGTLFLDEVAELTDAVQAKLLRLLENKEVMPVGASRPKPVNLRVCTATHKDLRGQVTAGRLREDLYFRISSPHIALPPLRQRREEIPWLLALEVQRSAPDLVLRATLVEACLMRPWPGNIRELLNAARSAFHSAAGRGSPRLDAQDLDDTAGNAFAPETQAKAAPPTRGPRTVSRPARAVLEAALQRADGNVTAAARALGVHRTQLRRWVAHYAIPVQSPVPPRRRCS
jgi:DNA-binding NtrC family response regulator